MFFKNLLLYLACFLVLLSNAQASFFYASGSLKAGYGSTLTSDTTTVPTTNMSFYAAEAGLGIKFYGILLGANGEYSFARQLTEPSKVSNINTQGVLTGVYPTIGFDLGVLRIIGKFPKMIAGDYSLEKTTSSGSKVIYKDAKVTAIQLHWQPGPAGLVLAYVNETSRSKAPYWGIEYSTTTFKKVSIAGTESTLTDAKQLQIKSYSLLYGFFF